MRQIILNAHSKFSLIEAIFYKLLFKENYLHCIQSHVIMLDWMFLRTSICKICTGLQSKSCHLFVCFFVWLTVYHGIKEIGDVSSSTTTL